MRNTAKTELLNKCRSPTSLQSSYFSILRVNDNPFSFVIQMATGTTAFTSRILLNTNHIVTKVILYLREVILVRATFSGVTRNI